jgi:hypothetical protein
MFTNGSKNAILSMNKMIEKNMSQEMPKEKSYGLLSRNIAAKKQVNNLESVKDLVLQVRKAFNND